MEGKLEYGYEIAGRYVYRKALGSGACGSVFLAYDRKISKLWAVKMCENIRGYEAEALKKIDHCAFPRIVDVCEQDKAVFLVMDYVEGESLGKYCRNHAVSQRQILIWCRKIAEAIEYLHNMTPSLLYMDCKPDNIMLTTAGEIRLVDLGSIYVKNDDISNIVSGTEFFAPEEITKYSLHKLEYTPDERSDIYSLGMTMYTLLTGCRVEYRDRYGNICARRQNKNISRVTEQIIRKCTSRKKRDRYQSMHDVAVDLRRAGEKGIKGRVSDIKSFLGIRIIRLFDILCKCAISCTILVVADKYSKTLERSSLAIILLLAVLFLLLCRDKAVYSWENRKDIFCGAGARALLLLTAVLCPLLMKTQSIEASTSYDTESSMDVTLYDENGRCLLVRPGAVWEISDDINMSINREETSGGVCKITVLCDNSEGKHKMYSFLCRDIQDDVGK